LPRLNRIKSLLRRGGRRDGPEVAAGVPAAESQPRPHGRARLGIYIAYYGIDYLLGHFVIRRLQSLGKLVVFDRYFYDWFIQSYTEKTPRILLPLLRFIFPKPDLVVYLYNEPEVIHNRKPELTIEQIAQQEQRLRVVLQGLPRSVTIRTDVPADAIAAEIAGQVAENMIRRMNGNLST